MKNGLQIHGMFYNLFYLILYILFIDNQMFKQVPQHHQDYLTE